MRFQPHTVAFAAQHQLVARCGFHDTRAGERFLPCDSPPNRFRPGIPVNNPRTRLHNSVFSMPIGQFRPLRGGSGVPADHLRLDGAVFLENLPQALAYRLELRHSEGLELLLQRQSRRPAPVDIPRRVAVGARSRVQGELDDRQQLRPFIRKAPHNVHHEHAQDFLKLLMAPLNDSLLHRPPSRTEGLANPHQSQEFREQGAPELWPSVAPHNLRQSA